MVGRRDGREGEARGGEGGGINASLECRSAWHRVVHNFTKWHQFIILARDWKQVTSSPYLSQVQRFGDELKVHQAHATGRMTNRGLSTNPGKSGKITKIHRQILKMYDS